MEMSAYTIFETITSAFLFMFHSEFRNSLYSLKISLQWANYRGQIGRGNTDTILLQPWYPLTIKQGLPFGAHIKEFALNDDKCVPH